MSDHTTADEPTAAPSIADIAFEVGRRFGVIETKLDRLIEIATADRPSAVDEEARP